MLQEEMLKLYQDWKFKCSAYQMALNIITIDKQTVAPPDGAAYRDERTAFWAANYFLWKPIRKWWKFLPR